MAGRAAGMSVSCVQGSHVYVMRQDGLGLGFGAHVGDGEADRQSLVTAATNSGAHRAICRSLTLLAQPSAAAFGAAPWWRSLTPIWCKRPRGLTMVGVVCTRILVYLYT